MRGILLNIFILSETRSQSQELPVMLNGMLLAGGYDSYSFLQSTKYNLDTDARSHQRLNISLAVHHLFSLDGLVRSY